MTAGDSGGRYGKTYGGIMMVIGDNGQEVFVNVSTWPNPKNPSPGIALGTFNSTYSTTGHKGVTNGVRLENGNPIPTLGPNPEQNGKSIATGVNIHCGSTQMNRGSAGCVTIQPDQCQEVWNVLKEGSTGTVTVSRNPLIHFWLWFRSQF